MTRADGPSGSLRRPGFRHRCVRRRNDDFPILRGEDRFFPPDTGPTGTLPPSSLPDLLRAPLAPSLNRVAATMKGDAGHGHRSGQQARTTTPALCTGGERLPHARTLSRSRACPALWAPRLPPLAGPSELHPTSEPRALWARRVAGGVPEIYSRFNHDFSLRGRSGDRDLYAHLDQGDLWQRHQRTSAQGVSRDRGDLVLRGPVMAPAGAQGLPRCLQRASVHCQRVPCVGSRKSDGQFRMVCRVATHGKGFESRLPEGRLPSGHLSGERHGDGPDGGPFVRRKDRFFLPESGLTRALPLIFAA